MKWLLALFVMGVGFLTNLSCYEKNDRAVSEEVEVISTTEERTKAIIANEARLTFLLILNPEVYRATDYGEPPQIAIWLEQPVSGRIRTVWVTRRTAKGDWAGKVECLTALPFWVSRYNLETETKGPPTFRMQLTDAITGATPKHELTINTSIPKGSEWDYYIEVNVSADYNEAFPAILWNGMPDPDGNGQPSLVYSGQVRAHSRVDSIPQLIGRTKQWQTVDHIVDDIIKITSAKNLFSKIEVSCDAK